MAKSKSTSGSYYIRARATGWYLYHQRYEAGDRLQARVDDKAFRDLGFRTTMSVDDAKAHCEQLNAERSLTNSKIRMAAKRVTEIQSLDSVLFPEDRIAEFQSILEEQNFGSEAHLHKLFSHFVFIQKMCNALRIQPFEYFESSKKIYKYFIKQKISTNYAERIVKLLNRWGRFVSKKNGSFFENVPVPRGREKSAIAEAQLTKQGTETELGVRMESRPLILEILAKAKPKLSLENYNWLYLSVWLGLRPDEVDSLKDEKRYRLEFKLKKKVHVLHVYQSKLQSIAAAKRWKAIPLIFAEQHRCIEILESQKFKKPIYKTMRTKVAKGVTLYGGRKAFTDLMLSKGQKIEDISIWLGHKDISTTWKHYKDKVEIEFTVTEETKFA